MKKLSEINQQLSSLISTDSKDEDINTIKEIQKDLEEYAQNEVKLQDDYVKLREKYINLVKNTPVYDPSVPQTQKPKSLDEIINKVLGGK